MNSGFWDYMVCWQNSEINFVARELGTLRRRDHYEVIGISLLYPQSKFELAGMNIWGSVLVCVDVHFVTASQKWRTISSNVMK
jgi:hypothetical protein